MENNNVETVTLTLKRYEEMTEKIRKMDELTIGLKKEVKALENLIKKMGIPPQLIDKLSKDIPVTVVCSDDIRGLNKEYMIHFDVSMSEMRKLSDE